MLLRDAKRGKAHVLEPSCKGEVLGVLASVSGSDSKSESSLVLLIGESKHRSFVSLRSRSCRWRWVCNGGMTRRTLLLRWNRFTDRVRVSCMGNWVLDLVRLNSGHSGPSSLERFKWDGSLKCCDINARIEYGC